MRQEYSEVHCYVDMGVLGEDVEVLVDFTWYGGRSQTLTEPGEEETIEIDNMTFWVEGTHVNATGHDALADAVESQCWDHLQGYANQEADYRIQDAKDRKLEERA